jgi:hypothetical protein
MAASEMLQYKVIHLEWIVTLKSTPRETLICEKDEISTSSMWIHCFGGMMM